MSNPAAPFSFDTAWETLRSWMNTMIAVMGEPVAIAARMMLRRSDREEILEWLAPLEAGVRRMLLMEAVNCGKPNEPPAPVIRGRVSNSFREEPRKDLPEDSKEWRVGFRLWPAALSKEPPKQPIIRASQRAVHYNAYPLARRVEAVIRVMENPAAYIAKLARRIFVEPDLTREIFRPHRAKLRGAEFMLRDIHHETELALEKLNSS